MQVRKGDTVVVIAGKEKGKRGRILRVVTDKERAVVERVNMVKRHTKPTQANPRGGILEEGRHDRDVQPGAVVREVWQGQASEGGHPGRPEEAADVREVRKSVRNGVASARRRNTDDG